MDFSQMNRASIGAGKNAAALSGTMTKKFGIEQVLRHRAALEFFEWC